MTSVLRELKRRKGSRADEPMSVRGKAAALTTGLVVALVGAATVWAAWGELRCPYGGPRGRAWCETTVAVGGLFTMAGLMILGIGAAVLWKVAGRPVENGAAGDGWTWGLGSLVAAGVFVSSVLVHRYTCPPGTRLTAFFALCVADSGDRMDARDWIWLKILILAVAPVAGLIVARWRSIPWPVSSAVTVAAVGVPFVLVIQRSVRFPL